MKPAKKTKLIAKPKKHKEPKTLPEHEQPEEPHSNQEEQALVQTNQGQVPKKYTYLVNSIEPAWSQEPLYTGGRIVTDGIRLFCSSDGKIRIFDPINNQTLSLIEHKGQQIANFSVNTAATHIATFTSNGLLRYVNLATGTVEHTAKIGHFVLDMAFSPSDKHLALGCVNNAVKIYSVATWKETHGHNNHRFSVKRIEWHPDPQRLQLSSLDEERNLVIYDLLLGQVTGATPQAGSGFSLTSKGSNVVSCDTQVKVWDYRDLKLQYAVEAGNYVDCMFVMDLIRNKKSTPVLFFSGENLPLSMIDLNDATHTIQQLQGLSEGVIVKMLALKNKLVLVSLEQNIFVVDYAQGFKLERTILGYNDQITDLKFSKATKDGEFNRNNQLMAVATNSSLLKMVEVATGNAHLVAGHKDIIMSVDYVHPYVLTGSKDKVVKLWKVDDNNKVNIIANYKGHTEDVTGVVLAAESKLVISISQDKTVKLWPMPVSEMVTIKTSLFTVVAHQKLINSVKINHNETLIATCSQDRTIKVWDIKDLSCKLLLKGHKRSVWDTAFNKIEKILASVSADGAVKIWNLVTGTCISTMGGTAGGHGILRVNWLFHNQVVTGSVDGIITIWDVRKMTSIPFDKHEGKIWALDVSAMDKQGEVLIATGANDSKLIVWQDATAKNNDLKMRENEEGEQQKLMFDRLFAEKHFAEAAELAFKSNLKEKCIHALQRMICGYNEEEKVTVEEDDITGEEVPESYHPHTNNQEIDKLVQIFAVVDSNRLIMLIQDLNATSRYFRLANILLYTLLRTHSLEDLVKFDKTFQEEKRNRRNESAETINDKESDFEKFLRRMRLYNERHSNRLENYIKNSFWIDFLNIKAQRI